MGEDIVNEDEKEQLRKGGKDWQAFFGVTVDSLMCNDRTY